MAQLFEELKRRKVFRVGAAYGVVAWALTEAASVALPTFEAPAWALQVITFMAIIGFPCALVLAWSFDITPEGVKRDAGTDPDETAPQQTDRKWDFIIIGVLAVSVVYFALDKFVFNARPEPVAKFAEPAPTAEPAPRDRSIAVLPFVNMSSDPEQEYFSDGLSEEILNLLAQLPGLKVAGRTSSFAFKGKTEDLRSIGQALGVGTVLEGSVRKSGERVRITAQLIEVSTGMHIWSGTFDRTITDIFAVQEDVASAIRDALQIEIGVAPKRGRPTENPDAYALFLKGRDAMNRFDAQRATQLLLESVELDPLFAEAYELLAYTYWYQSSETMSASEAYEGVSNSSQKALALDPSLVFARAILIEADHETYTSLTIEALERAANERSNQEAATEILTWVLMAAGYFDEALVSIERLVASDPLSPAAQIRLFQALSAVGRRDEALEALKLADHLGGDTAKLELFHFYLEDKRDEIAIAHLETYLREAESGLPTDWVRGLVAGARDPESGQAHLDRRVPQIVASMPEERSYEIEQVLTRSYLSFGFLDRFYELLDELGTTTSQWNDADVLSFAATITRQSGFTAHSKYLEVAEKYEYGVVTLWDQRGPPDHCEKLDGQWICE
jgi:TolB-like protein